MTQQHSFITALVLLTLLNVSALRAQGDDTAHLGTVVISASKVPKPASTLTQAVTVIHGEDLRARGVSRVIDALREVPGAMLVQSGSSGAVTSLFLRGGESRYTKVLIDGVPVNASGGFFDFSHLTTDNVDRIEIVRGPASVLYGADAVSGIVQIFTRKSSGESHGSFGARAGTYHSFDVDADASGGNSIGGFSLGAARHSTNGILPFNNEYRNGTLSSAFTLGGGSAGDAAISARYTTAEFHYPTDFTGLPVDSNSYRTQHRLTLGVTAGRDLSEHAQARILAGTNEVSDLSEDIAIPFGGTAPAHSASRSRAHRRNAEGRVSFFLPTAATLTLGGNYEQEHERSSNGAGPVGGLEMQTDSFNASRHTVAYYSELLGNPDEHLSYTLSGRVDDNSDYHRFGTYRIGAIAGLVPTIRLRASLSTAFNAPSFSELRPTLFTVGSPSLRPEQVHSAEVGIVTSLRAELVRFSATYFEQRFADLIQFVNGGPPDYKGSYGNLTGATSNGYEAELAVTPSSAWRGNASFAIMKPKVTKIPSSYGGDDRVGDALLRRPSHAGSLVLSYGRTAGIKLGAALNYVGQRPDLDFSQFPSPRVTLPAYTKLDLSVEQPLASVGRGGVTLNARLENALNKRYEDVLHFAAPRRTILIGARASSHF